MPRPGRRLERYPFNLYRTRSTRIPVCRRSTRLAVPHLHVDGAEASTTGRCSAKPRGLFAARALGGATPRAQQVAALRVGYIHVRARKPKFPARLRSDTHMERRGQSHGFCPTVPPTGTLRSDHYELILNDIPGEIALVADPMVPLTRQKCSASAARTHSRAASGRAPATRELGTWEPC